MITGDRYHASLGTAEVLLRMLDAPVSPEGREHLAEYLINCVRHGVPGKFVLVLVAGVKTGLLMRCTLQMAGISDRAGCDRLDVAVMKLPFEGALPAGTITVSGARNDDGVLALTVRGDAVDPAEVFAAVLRHGNDELFLLLEATDREVPPARSTVLTGGWASMRSVHRAHAQVSLQITLSEREQDTADGTALFARRVARAEHHGVDP